MTEPETRKVLIVDDHPLVRQGIATMIQQTPGLEVSGEAASANEALQAIEDSLPDIAIVDLTLKDSSGLELIKDIRYRHPKLPILVLSMRDEGFYAERCLRAGARGYITKEEGRQKLLEGISKILAGQIFISERMASKVMGTIVGSQSVPEQFAIDKLTDRELEILEHLGKGLSTRDIAEKLCISTKTVDSHREHLKQKLQLDNAAELTRYAIQWVQCQNNV